MNVAKINEQVKRQKMMTPVQFARIALKGLERNEPIISPVPLWRTMNIIFTLFPGIHRRLMRLVCHAARKASINTEVESSKIVH
ncbi:hypothetical protein ACFSO7_23960 [Bacillus sp. CGMCC 1.16607]|uniref:hypothetical protein n=1 Tax=Bacillus sp. CGMCC 1.16607 TaxID=3351842 RepID=UPI00362E6A5D